MDDKTIRMDSNNDPSNLQNNVYQTNNTNSQGKVGDPLADYRLPSQSLATHHSNDTIDPYPQVKEQIISKKPINMSNVGIPGMPPPENQQADFSWQNDQAPYIPPVYCSLSILTNIIVLIASLRIGVELILFVNVSKGTQFSEIFLYLVDNVLYLCTFILFLVWIYRAYKNLESFYTADLKATPLLSVLSFIIPLVNFYWPYRCLQEIWRASDPTDSFRRVDPYSWRTKRPSQLINFWWGTCIIYNIWILIVFFSLSELNLKPTSILLLFGIIMNVLTIILVNRITNLQDEKISYLS